MMSYNLGVKVSEIKSFDEFHGNLCIDREGDWYLPHYNLLLIAEGMRSSFSPFFPRLNNMSSLSKTSCKSCFLVLHRLYCSSLYTFEQFNILPVVGVWKHRYLRCSLTSERWQSFPAPTGHTIYDADHDDIRHSTGSCSSSCWPAGPVPFLLVNF